MKRHYFEISSLLGALASIGSAMTLERVGVAFGIVTGLTTCALNVFYMLRKDAREQQQAELAMREAQARLAALEGKERRGLESASKL